MGGSAGSTLQHSLGQDLARMGLKFRVFQRCQQMQSESLAGKSNLYPLLGASLMDISQEPYSISDQRAALGDDIIQALECLKSWSRKEVIMGMEVRSDGWKKCFRTLNSEQPTCTASKGAGTVYLEGAGSGDWKLFFWYFGFLFNHTCIVVQYTSIDYGGNTRIV